MHRAETVKRAAAIKRGQVTQAEKRRDRVILYSALVALRWLLYAVFCYYSSLALFWLYAVLALRCLLSPFSLPTPRTSTESPPNLYLPNLHSISAESLPNLRSQCFACLYSVSLRCSLGCGPCRAACASLCHCCLSCLSCNVGFLGSHARISHVAECFP